MNPEKNNILVSNSEKLTFSNSNQSEDCKIVIFFIYRSLARE